jgi:DNA-binding LacI/PurR family transcriptional regulator
MQGYEMTMYRNNLKPVIKTLTPKGTPTSREEQTQDLANLLDPLLNEPDPPTALVTYDADFAVRLTWLAYDRHWRLPEKFSVVSCDTSQNLSRLSPRITAMNNQLDVIGSEAVRMLLKKIESPHTPQPSRYVKGELKIFESVKDLNGD